MREICCKISIKVSNRAVIVIFLKVLCVIFPVIAQLNMSRPLLDYLKNTKSVNHCGYLAFLAARFIDFTLMRQSLKITKNNGTF